MPPRFRLCASGCQGGKLAAGNRAVRSASTASRSLPMGLVTCRHPHPPTPRCSTLLRPPCTICRSMSWAPRWCVVTVLPRSLSQRFACLTRAPIRSQVPFAGYEMPLIFKGKTLMESHLHTRESASLFDVSHMGQFQCVVACSNPLLVSQLTSLAFVPRPVTASVAPTLYTSSSLSAPVTSEA